MGKCCTPPRPCLLADADKEGLNERVIKYGVDVQPGSDQLEAGRELGKTAAQRLYALDPVCPALLLYVILYTHSTFLSLQCNVLVAII